MPCTRSALAEKDNDKPQTIASKRVRMLRRRCLATHGDDFQTMNDLLFETASDVSSKGPSMRPCRDATSLASTRSAEKRAGVAFCSFMNDVAESGTGLELAVMADRGLRPALLCEAPNPAKTTPSAHTSHIW